MHSILEMQDYKETYSALVLLSVLLTSCVKAISYSTQIFSKWKSPKPEVTVASGWLQRLLLLHEVSL